MSLATLTYKYYKIKNNSLTITTYQELVLIYNQLLRLDTRRINMSEWNSLYVHNKNILPEVPPGKSTIIKLISNILTINYMDMIPTYYNLIDKITNSKKLTKDIIDKFKFMVFIFGNQSSVNNKIDENIWKRMRNRCLVGKDKTKMPREPILLQDLIRQINGLITMNS